MHALPVYPRRMYYIVHYGHERPDIMKVFYSDHFVLPLPEDHRFPMVKYSMLRERVARDGICGQGELLTPRAVTDQEILRAHAPDYLKRVVSGTLTEKEVRRIGFP